MPQRAIKILSRTCFTGDVDANDDDHEGYDGCEESRREVAFPSLQLPFVIVGRDTR
jgi:hypothetical protein